MICVRYGKRYQETTKIDPEEKRTRSQALYNEAADLVLELRPYCDHSETMPYLWEHDNRYETVNDYG